MREVKQAVRKRSGYTLTEIIIAMIIVAVLVGAATVIGYKSIENARIKSVENDMRVFAANINEAYDQVGALSIDDSLGAAQKEEAVTDYLDSLSRYYLSFNFDLKTLEITAGGFKVNTAENLLDAWKNPYTMYCSTAGANAGRIIFASSGANAKNESEEYENGKFSDDIVMLIKERE